MDGGDCSELSFWRLYNYLDMTYIMEGDVDSSRRDLVGIKYITNTTFMNNL